MSSSPRSPLDAVVRAEWPRIVASLIRTTGDWDLAEDCAQDATERALRAWPRDGVPDNPAAWLTSVARRRALDVLRRRRTESQALQDVVAMTDRVTATFDAGSGYADDRLRLLFTCCHPDLTLQDRVALTLKSVSGLSTREIARLLLVKEQTMSQRLRRLRQQIARSGLALSVPPTDEIGDRVASVLAVIYLVFTEGYSATEGTGVRDELADEAIALAQLATWLLPEHSEAHALRVADPAAARAKASQSSQHGCAHPARRAGPHTLGPAPDRCRPRGAPTRSRRGRDCQRRDRCLPSPSGDRSRAQHGDKTRGGRLARDRRLV